ncbi:MAG TPA: TlpA disulfide reductase family protein [Pyrinomonadaceae bacterium]|jgi:peroxiredoxin
MRYLGLCLFLSLALSSAAFAQKNQFGYPAQVLNSAPDFVATALSGETYKLSDLKGKIVVLNFWSIKCPACEYETPDLNRIVDEYKNKDVVFLAFAHDAQPKVQRFLQNNPFKYEVFPASLQQMMTIYGRPIGNGFFDLPFPLHVVINKQGIVEVNELGTKGVKAVRRKLAELTE